MKKSCLVLLLLLLNFAFAYELKDSGLIEISEIKKHSSFAKKRKALVDKKDHAGYKNILSKEEYDIYLITEKILRANNLQYKNWRVGFNLDKDIINAVSMNNNLIIINSSLYDCLHQNKDALAFVICHELAHFILCHQKTNIENSYKLKRIEEEIKRIENSKMPQGEIFSRNLKNLANNIYQNMRTLELKTDNEALVLLLRAGYDPNSALEVFEYLNEDYNFYENKNTYPLIYQRIENIKKEYSILEADNLIEEGENNLILSKALSVQKSMDKETLVINRPQNYKDYSYILTTRAQKLINKGYSNYKKEKINEAIDFFAKAQEEDTNNFIPALYLSYCYEYKYQKEDNKNYLKLCKRYIKKAKQLNPKDNYVISQYKNYYKR